MNISTKLLEALTIARLSSREYKIILAIFKKTYGEHKDIVNISLTGLAAITGLEKANVSKTLKHLERDNIILTVDKVNNVFSYRLNADFSTWKIIN